MKILIVGATGQLGFTICKKLIGSGNVHSVIAAFRESSDTSALMKISGIQTRLIDLRNPDTFKPALKDIDVVITSANTATPRLKTDSFKRVDEEGTMALINAAKAARVKHFIYVSAYPFSNGDETIPLSRSKRVVEKHLKFSGLTYTIIQPTAFMEVYFPFFGSTVPLRGAEVNTVDRPFKFSNDFFAGIKNDIEEKGVFNVIGKGNKKNAYVSIDNVADFCISSIDNPKAKNQIIPVGGPEGLTPLEVKSIFESLYGKPLKVKSTPPFVIKLMSKILPLFNPAAGNIMALNYAVANNDCIPPNIEKTAKEYGVQLIHPKEFLQKKFEIKS
jgi:uncharacterized protein YbjT (DUF2867 family)